MEAAARTARQNHTEPGDRPMIRHGMMPPPAVGTQLQATNLHASMPMIDGKGGASRRATSQQHHAEAQQSGLSASILVLPDGARAPDDTGRNPKSP
jgi:hypothetical protein